MPIVNTPTTSANLQMAAATRILTEHILYTLEEETATHSSVLALENPMDKSGGLRQFAGSTRVRHDLMSGHYHVTGTVLRV